MRASYIFWGGLIVLIALMFVVQSSLPKQFVWKPTFSRYDKEPFGCAIFDDVLLHSLDYYEVTDETLYLLSLYEDVSHFNILSVSKDLRFTDTDLKALVEVLEEGANVMLVASRFYGSLRDTFDLGASYSYYGFEDLAKRVINAPVRDTLQWVDPSLPWGEFDFYSAFGGVDMMEYDSLFTPVLVSHAQRGYVDADTTVSILKSHLQQVDTENKAVPARVIRRKVGNGELFLCTMPLLFTNYGMLDRDNSEQIFRLLSLMEDPARDRLFMRTNAYSKEAKESSTPFRYFLSQPPLRWGLYMTMLVILLFMIFTARRRQRAIPIIKEPENKWMEFTELIGTLYFRKHDNAGLIRKKYVFFSETLRRMAQVDIEDTSQHEQTIERIAGITGMDKDSLSTLLTGLHLITTQEVSLTDSQMKQYINDMNEIINHLYI